MNQLRKIEQRRAPLKDALLNHRIYGEIDRIDALRLFMEHHAGNEWQVESPTGLVGIRFLPANEFGVFDHVVTLPDGRRS